MQQRFERTIADRKRLKATLARDEAKLDARRRGMAGLDIQDSPPSFRPSTPGSTELEQVHSNQVGVTLTVAMR